MISRLKNLFHYLIGLSGSIYYCLPSNKIKVVGITGTKGKTTTVELASFIFERCGFKTAHLSSTSIKIGDKKVKNRTGNSMPGMAFIHKFLRASVKEGCQFAFVEVTSQGILQHRHQFINWDKAVFLNIHPEHIEAHGSFEKYLSAKLKFFEYAVKNPKTKFFVNNKTDHSGQFIQAAGKKRVKLFTREDVKTANIYPPKTLEGDFNLDNIACVLSLALDENIKIEDFKKALKEFPGVEGRMNKIIEKPFEVYVDYAHTPDSLEAVYKYLSSIKKGRLICLLGSAGGGRDKWKRPAMGKIAGNYCNSIILTNEDPYDEEPSSILSEIKNGIATTQFSKSDLYEILDRREAIKKAVSLAKEKDIIISTGKGSEEYIHIKNGKKIPWSETGEFEGAFGKMVI